MIEIICGGWIGLNEWGGDDVVEVIWCCVELYQIYEFIKLIKWWNCKMIKVVKWSNWWKQWNDQSGEMMKLSKYWNVQNYQKCSNG